MTGYDVKIIDSSKELTARERIAFKNFDDAIQLDSAVTPESPRLLIDVEGYVVASVHNDKSDNVDYEKYIIIDKEGQRYITGSQPFFSSFKEIWDEMYEENEPWSIAVYKRESNNYKGKQFLTCTIC
jgi:hypothetical protein